MNKTWTFKVVAIAIALLIPNFAIAEWVGPQEIVNENLGDGENEIGRILDEMQNFPNELYVFKDFIVLKDEGNRRQKVYDKSGKLIEIVNWKYTDLNSYKIEKYNIFGEPIAYNESNLYTVYSYKIDDYFIYDNFGNKLSMSKKRPIEIWYIENVNTDGDIKIIFKNKIFKLKNTYGKIEHYHVLDGKNLILSTRKGNSYAVIEINNDGEILSKFTMPESKGFSIKAHEYAEPMHYIEIEYGRPIISLNGDIFSWAGTDDKYMILKWERQQTKSSNHEMKADEK